MEIININKNTQITQIISRSKNIRILNNRKGVHTLNQIKSILNKKLRGNKSSKNP